MNYEITKILSNYEEISEIFILVKIYHYKNLALYSILTLQ